MKSIKREQYLQKLIDRRENGLIKIITGIRRTGKSYLLDPIFKEYLVSSGVDEAHIIKLDLDERRNARFLDPDVLDNFVRGSLKDDKIYYVLLDEIQRVSDFESVLNGFLHIKNLDVYVTGSNSKFLSSDVITEFRGRGDEIHVYPLSFSEYVDAANLDLNSAWSEYVTYGGLPHILSMQTDEQKASYLKELFTTTYVRDIVERNNIERVDVLDSLINILASSVGSLASPHTLANTFKSVSKKDVSENTISAYIKYLRDAFIVEKVDRFDIKGKKYISTPSKYYYTDVGLRNARLNYRQQEENHLMENVIYNELKVRGYNVDVGVVEIREKEARKQLEVDFVCNQGSKRYYIQSAFEMSTEDKRAKECRSLVSINDSFKKIIIEKDNLKPWHDENGILNIGLLDFLMDAKSLDL